MLRSLAFQKRAANTTSAGRTYTSGRLASMEVLNPLACHSRKPHSHPNQHTEEELILIRNMRRRNPKLGIVELWARLRKSRLHTLSWKACGECCASRGAGGESKSPGRSTKPKPYEQMQYPGQRCPDRCESRTAKLYSWPAIETVPVHSDR